MSSIHSVASSNPFSDRHAEVAAPQATPPLRPSTSRPPSYTLEAAPPAERAPAAPQAPLPQALPAREAAPPSVVQVAPSVAPVAAPVAPSVAPAAPLAAPSKRMTAPATAPAATSVPEPRKRAAKQGFLRTYTLPGQLLPPRLEPLTAAQRASARANAGRGKSVRTKLQEKLLKHTSGVGLAKLGAKVGLLGLAGVGSYFAVTQIIALAHAGVSAKVGAILLPVGIAVAATLAIVVLLYMVSKSFKAMRRDLKGELGATAPAYAEPLPSSI